jgi:RHS repeat-associated protein
MVRKRVVTSRGEWGRFRRPVAFAVTVLVAVALMPALPALADDGTGRPAVQHVERAVKGHRLMAKPRTPDPATRRRVPPKAAWPTAGTAQVTLPSTTPGTQTAMTRRALMVRAGKLPVSVGAPLKTPKSAQQMPGRVKVTLLDQRTARRTGANGPLLTLTRSDSGTVTGRVGVRLDYTGFVDAFGGSFGSRLRLVQLPGCALTTPQRPECTRPTPLAGRNDTETKALTADVDVAPAVSGATVLAATAGASSDKGDFTATPLSASGTWQVGEQTGDFSWSYPMRVPPVPGDLTPKVAIDYSSGSVDGRTSNMNGQPSWVGEGFDLWSGYIDRGYKACSDDGAPQTNGSDPGDECWGFDNATISLNGKANELIQATDGTWRLKDDDGTRVERFTDTATGNGDNDGEYWKVTTPDGTQYFFGKNRLPGWTSGKPETNSTWTVPVFGDDSGEPCHGGTFADSWCQQAWRWNLDYVVDPHGNAIAYYYKAETNSYARDLKASDDTPYTRGGYIDHIEYGLRSDDLFAQPSAKVNFGTSERCIPDANVDCDASNIDAHPENWPDVPWDLNCDAGTDCEDTDLNTIKASPSFWSRKRLTGVTTQILKTDGSYQDVDSWALSQDWGLADVDRDLLLESITHTGSAGATPITLPPVTFDYVQRPNRVDKLGDDVGPYIKYRLGGIFDESGGQIDVNYSDPECTTDALPTPETNTKRCFPVYWVPPDGTKDPKLDWFHKYVVTQVTRIDRTGFAPDQVTTYDYQGGAAWHYDDDDGLTREKYKTWSQWRGYATVREQSGGDNDMRTQTDHLYFRGMDGDRLNKDGGTKSITVSDGEGGSYPDENPRQGFELKTTAYLSPGGDIASKTINTIWTHETARRVRSWGTTTANLTGTASTRTLTALDGGNWRETLIKNTFENTAGLTTQVDDQGDTSTDTDDRCTNTDYATNTTARMLDFPSRVETVAVKCGDPVDRPAQVISDVRTYYDNGNLGAAPTQGDVTKTDKIADYDGGAPHYVTTATTTFDTYGRVLTATDAANNTTTTSYTPATGLPTALSVTGPPVKPGDTTTAMKASSTLDPAWNLPTSQIDAGGKRTDVDHDALGRLTKVWLANGSKAAGNTPNLTYTYLITKDSPVAVETQTIRPDESQIPSYQLYDGFLRPRQTQDLGPNGGRLITDTFYDALGKTARTYATYYATGAPDSALFGVDTPGDIESQTAYDYDGLGRVTTERLLTGGGDGQEKWRTTTTYSGDRVNVDPPTGGTPTTTITDARGQTTEVRQYQGDSPTGDYDATTYTYTPAGQLHIVTDAAGNKWTHTYDLRGREIQTDDPDKGTTTTGYDDLDQVTSITDARGQKLFYAYDPIGRKTEERKDSPTGPVLTSWVYDTVRKGQLTSVTRNIAGANYVITNNAYNNLNQPTRTTYTIPSVTGEEKLAGSYQFNTSYNLDDTIQSTTFPLVSQASGMPDEGVIHHYDEMRRPTTTTANSSIVTNTQYTLTGKPQQYELSTGGKKTWLTYSYEFGTQRLSESRTDREDIAGVDRDATYTYDDAGNLKSATDTSRAGTDTQCFTYDYLQRLTEAWTPTNSCDSAPDKTLLGGPAPYWSSYRYDSTGNRTSETQHGIGAVATDTTRTYHYPDPGQGQHQLDSITQTGAAGNRTDSYGYDAAGNTTTRDIGNAHQTLTWDTEEHLATTTDSTGTTGYAYTADGNRLLRRDPTSTTLYLPDMELRLDKTTNQLSGTRYYTHNGVVVAMRTSAGIQFLATDPHGTAEQAITGDSQTLTQRRFDPFGQFRGSPTGIWPNDKGFVGGTIDPSGLTNLGAREYDPSTARFISVDPVFDIGDPQSWNGYAYADNDPTTKSDPTGTEIPCNDGACGPSQFWDNHTDTGEKKKHKSTLSTIVHSSWNFSVGVSIESLKSSPYPYAVILRIPGVESTVTSFLGVDTDSDSYIWGGRAFDIGLDVASFGEGLLASVGRAIAESSAREAAQAIERAAAEASEKQAAKSAAKDAAEKPTPKDDARPNEGGCKNSFIAGTQVLLANGTYKAIENIKIGDKVEAADPKTGKNRTEPVIAAFGGINYTNLIKITVDTDGKNGHHVGIVIASEHHKFWNPTNHTWIRADHLKPTTTLRTPTGKAVRVLRATPQPGHPTVHDLTIADLHTYYVEAGTTPVLVHNSGPFCGTPIGGKIGDKLGEEDFHGSEYSLDEIVEFVNGHTGDAKPGMVRPSPAQVETTLRNAGPVQIGDQNAARFDYKGVRVIVNYNLPWKSTAYFPER